MWDLRHLQHLQHHIFQDDFEWAGMLRTVDMAKDGNVFCRPQFIESAAADIFRDLAAKRHLRNLPRTEFVATAGELLSAVNSLHPFREGNGRTQRAFLSRMAAQAGWMIDWTLLDPERNITASVAPSSVTIVRWSNYSTNWSPLRTDIPRRSRPEGPASQKCQASRSRVRYGREPRTQLRHCQSTARIWHARRRRVDTEPSRLPLPWR
jgi:fido (protein-threonine AMPylation protein)